MFIAKKLTFHPHFTSKRVNNFQNFAIFFEFLRFVIRESRDFQILIVDRRSKIFTRSTIHFISDRRSSPISGCMLKMYFTTKCIGIISFEI